MLYSVYTFRLRDYILSCSVRGYHLIALALMSWHTSGKEATRRLTHTLGLLPAPVRCGCVATGEHFGALQLVAGETAEEGFSAGVEVRHRNLSTGGLFGERTAQDEGWRGKKRGKLII